MVTAFVSKPSFSLARDQRSFVDKLAHAKMSRKMRNGKDNVMATWCAGAGRGVMSDGGGRVLFEK
jgi:hypothetical protein